MLTPVNEVYTNGNVILLEKPEKLDYSKVIVTFIGDDDSLTTNQLMKLSEPAFES